MKRILALAALALLVTGVAVGTVATRRPVRPIKTAQLVTLRLAAEGTELARISTLSGVMATMSREGGEQIGLTPSVQADGIGLTVAVRNATTGEFTIVGRYSLVRNVPTDVSTERTTLTVEWLETTTVTPAAGAAPAGTAPCTTCCIVCDGTTFCACEVTTNCGHCCCKETCGCVDGVI
jgi:hypothetical protein